MSSQEGSDATSYDSNHYGDVARAGFTRMYVLLHSAMSPLDQTSDYLSSDTTSDNDAKRCDDHDRNERPTRRRYEELEAAFDDQDNDSSSGGVERFQLLYANGRHYFHGTIPLPDGFNDDDHHDDDGSPRETPNDCRPSRRRHGRHRHDLAASIKVDDLPLLLPHFQQHQDELTVIDHVTHFRQELRDVVYQMEEVGEFMVEELSKDKIIQRIEEGSKEFHWMVSPQNPTFFELQTYRRTNESFQDAGVVLIVMKMVVRGVLLDVIYHNDSYFITLRENADELALEDTFVPSPSCVGPCFTVRRYSDTDLKQLLLWCAFPSHATSLSVDGSKLLHLPAAQVAPRVLKVAPMRNSTDDSTILQANDTQLYCLFPTSRTTTTTAAAAATTTRSKRGKRGGGESADDLDHELLVVFQFNQFLYNGTELCKNNINAVISVLY